MSYWAIENNNIQFKYNEIIGLKRSNLSKEKAYNILT